MAHTWGLQSSPLGEGENGSNRPEAWIARGTGHRQTLESHPGSLLRATLPVPPRRKQKGTRSAHLRDRGSPRMPSGAARHTLPPPCISGKLVTVMKITSRGSGGG